MQQRTVIVGVDPGVKGAVAFFDPPKDTLDVVDMPTAHYFPASGGRKTRVDMYALGRLIDTRADRVLRAFVEDVHSVSEQGIASAFSFGRSTGAVLMSLAAHSIPVIEVRPETWKADMGVPADKTEVWRIATRRWPQHAAHWPSAAHDGRVEAFLIAQFGAAPLKEMRCPNLRCGRVAMLHPAMVSAGTLCQRCGHRYNGKGAPPKRPRRMTAAGLDAIYKRPT